MPAKRTDDKYAVTTWASNTEDLECPSGQLCLVRRVDPMKLLSDGTLHKTDMITALVDQQHVAKKSKGGKRAAEVAAQKKTEEVLRSALSDPEKMQDLLDIINSVVLATVIKPELHKVPANEIDRKEGLVYIDSVALEDRLFIMNFAFSGTRDVARFRRELSQSAGSLADVESVEENAE